MVPVSVVTGFLGAGKTTLLNAWLAQYRPGDVAVIVNEVGDVGIDGELLAERARTLVEIAGGCVCCATYGELVRALAELSQSAVKRVFIETSGAASPAGVLRAIRSEPGVRLDGVVTVVDATRVRRLHENDLALEQVGYADVLVASRGEQLDETARATLAALNGAASIVATERGSIASFDALLARRSEGFEPTFASVPPHEIESISLVHEGELDEERFGDWIERDLARYSGRILRIKGILAIASVERRMILQGVADEIEITFGAPFAEGARTSRLVIVGFGLDREELAQGFNATRTSS